MTEKPASLTSSFMELLTPALQNKIEAAATLMRYTDGSLIHSRGDDRPGLSIVKSGAVTAGIYGPNGTFVIASVLGAGRTFGQLTLFAGLPRTHDMTAAGPTEILELRPNAFFQLFETEPDIPRALLTSTLKRSYLLMELLDAQRRLPLTQRTAKVLLLMMKTSGADRHFKARQSDLAFALGISRVSLGKALGKLKDLGLIEIGYGQISLINPEDMENWVAENCDIALFT